MINVQSHVTTQCEDITIKCEEKNKGTTECDKSIITSVMLVLHNVRVVPSNVRKNKGTIECDKSTITCDVSITQFEDDTIKYDVLTI